MSGLLLAGVVWTLIGELCSVQKHCLSIFVKEFSVGNQDVWIFKRNIASKIVLITGCYDLLNQFEFAGVMVELHPYATGLRRLTRYILVLLLYPRRDSLSA